MSTVSRAFKTCDGETDITEENVKEKYYEYLAKIQGYVNYMLEATMINSGDPILSVLHLMETNDLLHRFAKMQSNYSM